MDRSNERNTEMQNSGASCFDSMDKSGVLCTTPASVTGAPCLCGPCMSYARVVAYSRILDGTLRRSCNAFDWAQFVGISSWKEENITRINSGLLLVYHCSVQVSYVWCWLVRTGALLSGWSMRQNKWSITSYIMPELCQNYAPPACSNSTVGYVNNHPLFERFSLHHYRSFVNTNFLAEKKTARA